MNTIRGVIVSAITLLAVAQAGATPLYTIDLTVDDDVRAAATPPSLFYLHAHAFTVEASVGDSAVPVPPQWTAVWNVAIGASSDISTDAMAFAAGSSRPTAVAPEPSGLAAFAIVMVTVGIGGVMRLAQEVGAVVTQCARYRIELGGVRRWWATHRARGS